MEAGSPAQAIHRATPLWRQRGQISQIQIGHRLQRHRCRHLQRHSCHRLQRHRCHRLQRHRCHHLQRHVCHGLQRHRCHRLQRHRCHHLQRHRCHCRSKLGRWLLARWPRWCRHRSHRRTSCCCRGHRPTRCRRRSNRPPLYPLPVPSQGDMYRVVCVGTNNPMTLWLQSGDRNGWRHVLVSRVKIGYWVPLGREGLFTTDASTQTD